MQAMLKQTVIFRERPLITPLKPKMLRSIASLSTAALPSAPPIQFISRKYVNLRKSSINTILKKRFNPSNLRASSSTSFNIATHSGKSSDSDWEFGDEEIGEDDDMESPWEGAIMYKRNSAMSNLEYCTTLERLGLGKVSSEFSRTRASEMGLRVLKSVKDFPEGTPVLISVDVTRRKQSLRLDGIVRTVISLNCNRCGEPAAQSIYSDFSILLCDEPLPETETITMGMMFGEEKSKRNESMEDCDDASIDIDDRLFFPPAEKIIDISKNIRDLIHVEITITALCDPNCKGLCLKCGNNLNISKCICKNQKAEEIGYGPLANLRKQMQQK